MIAIIAAMTCELEKLVLASKIYETRTVGGLTLHIGSLEGKDVVMTVCGEGKVNAALCAQTLILLFSPELIINTGVAGALSPTLSVPDVAVASAVCEHDYDISPLGYGKGEVLFAGGSATYFACEDIFSSAALDAAKEMGIHAEHGAIASGDQFIASETKKEEIRSAFGAIACEMEGGAIGHVAFLSGVPFAVLRAISDNADNGESFDPIRAAEISVEITRRALAKM